MPDPNPLHGRGGAKMPMLHDLERSLLPLPLPRALRREPVDILSFVVTAAGWKALEDRIKFFSANPMRILTRLIYQSVIDPMKHAGVRWHCLPRNHSKVILYRQQKVAVLGSFNLTGPSLGDNIECLSRVDGAEYDWLAEEFDQYWKAAEEGGEAQTKLDEKAIVTRQAFLEALEAAFNPEEMEAPRQEVPKCQADLLGGRLSPWGFQENIIQQVMAWVDTARDVDLGRIVKLPTGAGKTLVAAEVIRGLLEQKPRARILWVCHRVELLRQSWLSVHRQIGGRVADTAWFVPKHVQEESILRDSKEFHSSKDCQVVFCTQGMLPHLLRYNRGDRFDLAVVDECHRFHPQSKTYRELSKYCIRLHVPRLGLTATPLDPPDKRGFGKYWDTKSMFGENLSWDDLVHEGYLSRRNKELTKSWSTNYRFKFTRQDARSTHPELELFTRIGEFNDDRVNCQVAKAWQKYRSLRQRVLCFAVSIDHVETLMKHYFSGDRRCVRAVHSKLPPNQNSENLEWFKEGSDEARMLVSVLIAAEGIDLPSTDCLFMVRPTFSPELHQQMIGRGFRGPKAGGTADCAVVDFTYQFVDRNEQLLQVPQVTTLGGNAVWEEVDGIAPEEDDDPDDLDASGRIGTVGDLREAVADLQRKEGHTIHAVCEKLAQELDYKATTLVNYLYTKDDDYPLGWEDPEAEPAEHSDDGSAADVRGDWSEEYVTKNKLLDLRTSYPNRFKEIASLTNIAAGTLQVYCSDQEKFIRWKTNNKVTMDQVRAILAKSFA